MEGEVFNDVWRRLGCITACVIRWGREDARAVAYCNGYDYDNRTQVV